MAQRICRAKQRDQGVRRAVRAADARRAAGAAAVRAARPVPDLQRGLCEQRRPRAAARRPVRRRRSGWRRLVQRLLPDDGEVAGLLALMLLIDARRPARTDADGRADPAGRAGSRARGIGRRSPRDWRSSTARSRRARSASTSSRRRSRPSTTAAPTAEDTDWPQILALYGLLERMTGNPVVTLNRAVAAAMADGPSAGLALLDGDRRSGWPGTTGSTPFARTCSRWRATRTAALRALPRGGGPDDEPARAALPDGAGRAAQADVSRAARCGCGVADRDYNRSSS